MQRLALNSEKWRDWIIVILSETLQDILVVTTLSVKEHWWMGTHLQKDSVFFFLIHFSCMKLSFKYYYQCITMMYFKMYSSFHNLFIISYLYQYILCSNKASPNTLTPLSFCIRFVLSLQPLSAYIMNIHKISVCSNFPF